MRVTFLGTGTSRGVPVIGCCCEVCRSEDVRNRRLRCSILIRGSAAVVVDTTTDFRQQMLRNDVRHLDALVFTHHHADHVLGLDDIFPLTVRSGRPLPIYASGSTLSELKMTFRHMFSEAPSGGVGRIEAKEITGPFEIGDLRFEPVALFHGELPVLGFRVGPFAYLTDVNRIPEESFEKLRGLDCVVLDGLRYRRHPTHFSISEAVAAAQRIDAQRAYLIHMSHDVEHERGNSGLPPGIQLAFDGLELEFQG